MKMDARTHTIADRVPGACVAFVLVLAGCQHAAPPLRVEGSSFVTFVEPAVARTAAQGAATIVTLQATDVMVPAEPIEPLAKPVYPRVALGAQKTPVLVGVRIRIDATGRVVEIGRSLASFSTAGPFDTEFREAIAEAVGQWRFIPAELRHLKPISGGPGRESYWLVTRAERTDYMCELSFTFTATGDILSDLPKQGTR